jgi:predicted sugar kinase
MYSKYIKELIKDFRKMAYKSFLDKHGPSAVALAKKMSERQKHEQTIDNENRGIR